MAFSLVASNAWAAHPCVRAEDELAMKTSTMQQSLMVAALSCGDVALYNRFVLSYRTELQRADAALLEFFKRENGRAGETDYHAFKTKAANVSALESARDQTNYCANARRLFAATVEREGANLAWLVTREWPMTAEVIHASCTTDADRPAERQRSASAAYGSEVPPSPVEPSLADSASQ